MRITVVSIGLSVLSSLSIIRFITQGFILMERADIKRLRTMTLKMIGRQLLRFSFM